MMLIVFFNEVIPSIHKKLSSKYNSVLRNFQKIPKFVAHG